jgi:hypothetical protein
MLAEFASMDAVDPLLNNSNLEVAVFDVTPYLSGVLQPEKRKKKPRAQITTASLILLN